MSDDTHLSLAEIALQRDVPLKHQLLAIQEAAVPQEKSLSFIRRLECFTPCPDDPLTLGRRRINAFVEKKYVAISYTWSPSPHETDATHGYQIQSRDDTLPPEPSPVRGSVFRRALAYAAHRGTPLIWIDRHSIEQHDPDLQRQAVQGMDLVYALSRQPVALLGRPVTAPAELHLLWRLVTSQLVAADDGAGAGRPRLAVPLDEALAALDLLDAITSDLWWTRAWTFQEAYRAGDRMALLISHPASLEAEKSDPARAAVFDALPGELVLRYTLFATASTRLCLALRDLPSPPAMTASRAAAVGRILATAARYTLLLPPEAPMSPAIITHIQHRALLNPSDRLAIAANCCWYPLRLDTALLARRRQSLALAVLALCLLNGEILHNGPLPREQGAAPSPAALPVAAYLRARLFSGLRAPRQEHRLTFNKSCRLPTARLAHDGIRTRGRLWRLGPVLAAPPAAPAEPSPSSSPTPREQTSLASLAGLLRGDRACAPLAEKLDGFLARWASSSPDAAAPDWDDALLRIMAASVASAAADGTPLQLAAPLSSSSEDEQEPYAAVFAPGAEALPAGSIVFTASRPRRRGTSDVDRHVSIAVDCFVPLDGGPPRLHTRQWVLGMCFPDGGESTEADVVFPWPSELEAFTE